MGKTINKLEGKQTMKKIRVIFERKDGTHGSLAIYRVNLLAFIASCAQFGNRFIRVEEFNYPTY